MDQQGQYDSEAEMNDHHEFLFKKAFAKLSAAQQKVINCMMFHDGSYIHKSPYYNHNRVVSKERIITESGRETHELMQFTRATLDCLIKSNIISQQKDNIYILNN